MRSIEHRSAFLNSCSLTCGENRPGSTGGCSEEPSFDLKSLQHHGIGIDGQIQFATQGQSIGRPGVDHHLVALPFEDKISKENTVVFVANEDVVGACVQGGDGVFEQVMGLGA